MRRNLQRDRLSPAYRSRLGHAAMEFCQYCRGRGVGIEKLKRSAELTSRLLVCYVQDLYDNGKAFWVGKHAVLAMQT
eukprot:9452776-Heterocapsa_arctica.AAC.1